MRSHRIVMRMALCLGVLAGACGTATHPDKAPGENAASSLSGASPIPSAEPEVPSLPAPPPRDSYREAELNADLLQALQATVSFAGGIGETSGAPLSVAKAFLQAILDEDSAALEAVLHTDCPWIRESPPLPVWWSVKRVELGPFTGLQGWGWPDERDADGNPRPDILCPLVPPIGRRMHSFLRLRPDRPPADAPPDEHWAIVGIVRTLDPGRVLPADRMVVRRFDASVALPEWMPYETPAAVEDTPTEALRHILEELRSVRGGEEAVTPLLLSDADREATDPMTVSFRVPSPAWELAHEGLLARLNRVVGLRLTGVIETDRYSLAGTDTVFAEVLAVFQRAGAPGMRRVYTCNLRTIEGQWRLSAFEPATSPERLEDWLQESDRPSFPR